MSICGEVCVQNITYLYRFSFVIGLVSLLLAKYLLPEFLKYGKTLVAKQNGEQNMIEDSVLNKFMHFTVPKAFFSHFYILSTFFSIIACYNYPSYALVWLVLFHSLRRLYETLYVSKYTIKSRMNWSHYLVGIWFYSVLHLILYLKLSQGDIPKELNVPALILLIIASFDQYMNHKVLSNLVKYSLPKERLFKVVSSPHYFEEILIYSSFLPYNIEFLWLVMWIIASLSISAIETQKYYKLKFPKEKTPDYAIIPFIL